MFLQADCKHTQNNTLKQNRNESLRTLVIFVAGMTVTQCARAVLMIGLRTRSRFQRMRPYQKTNSWKPHFAHQNQRLSLSAMNVLEHFTKFVWATFHKCGWIKMRTCSLVMIVQSNVGWKRYRVMFKLKVRPNSFAMDNSYMIAIWHTPMIKNNTW